MEHPLIGDISNINIEDLSSKINDLYHKLSIAQRGGNGYLCHQLRMAIETYQTQYQARLDQQRRDSPVDFNGIINIE